MSAHAPRNSGRYRLSSSPTHIIVYEDGDEDGICPVCQKICGPIGLTCDAPIISRVMYCESCRLETLTHYKCPAQAMITATCPIHSEIDSHCHQCQTHTNGVINEIQHYYDGKVAKRVTKALSSRNSPGAHIVKASRVHMWGDTYYCIVCGAEPGKNPPNE